MRLDDKIVRHLREIVDLPDFEGTRYRIEEELARGGMGTVYLAVDCELSREVAIKVLNVPDPSGELAHRMISEARHLARLDHPNIVPVHDVGRLPDDRVYYVMRRVQGRDLSEWREQDSSRPATLRLFQNVCEAVAYAHSQGVIHRDLKPENIMIGSFGEALVMDWGVAKQLRHEERDSEETGTVISVAQPPSPPVPGRGETQAGAVIGTPAYMAPEQARGEIDRLDERTDIYGLGSILYFLLSGQPPFSGSTAAEILRKVLQESPRPLRELDPALPRDLESICLKAMSSEASNRYPSARELADDVDRFLDGRAVLARRETLLDKGKRFFRSYRVVILLVFAYLLVRLLVLALTGR